MSRATWGESASKLMHVSHKEHVGFSKGLPHGLVLSFPQRERWKDDPQGEGASKTEATVVF